MFKVRSYVWGVAQPVPSVRAPAVVTELFKTIPKNPPHSSIFMRWCRGPEFLTRLRFQRALRQGRHPWSELVRR